MTQAKETSLDLSGSSAASETMSTDSQVQHHILLLQGFLMKNLTIKFLNWKVSGDSSRHPAGRDSGLVARWFSTIEIRILLD